MPSVRGIKVWEAGAARKRERKLKDKYFRKKKRREGDENGHEIKNTVKLLL
jgi:hypothetical protein